MRQTSDVVPLCSILPVQLSLMVVHIAQSLLFRKGKAALFAGSSPLPDPVHSLLPSPQPELSWAGCLGLAIERERHGRDSGELRRLLNSLECKQDEYTKSMILHSITRCVYLLEAEVRAGRQEAPRPARPGSAVPAVSLSAGGGCAKEPQPWGRRAQDAPFSRLFRLSPHAPGLCVYY